MPDCGISFIMATIKITLQLSEQAIANICVISKKDLKRDSVKDPFY